MGQVHTLLLSSEVAILVEIPSVKHFECLLLCFAH